MIRYSNDMAYLYGFTDTKGYDSNPRHYYAFYIVDKKIEKYDIIKQKNRK